MGPTARPSGSAGSVAAVSFRFLVGARSGVWYKHLSDPLTSGRATIAAAGQSVGRGSRDLSACSPGATAQPCLVRVEP